MIPLLSTQLTSAGREPLHLPEDAGFPDARHVFDEDSVLAIDAALTAGRPLLLRGEPGVGKSQLARAAAEALGRVFLPKVIDARTEARDLCWSFDAVARLAEAQLLGALPEMTVEKVRAELNEARFTTPGPLWWAFNWESASTQANLRKGAPPRKPRPQWKPADGTVLLLDEIDKADAAVPNGLLEALGNRSFVTPSGERVVADPDAAPPLIILTTNEERTLPDAFVRRCLVLSLRLPAGEALIDWLNVRGEAQFPGADPAILQKCAGMLAEDREDAKAVGVAPPGLAEYLDLLRAVTTQHPKDAQAQGSLLERIRRFAFEKHPREDRG